MYESQPDEVPTALPEFLPTTFFMQRFDLRTESGALRLMKRLFPTVLIDRRLRVRREDYLRVVGVATRPPIGSARAQAATSTVRLSKAALRLQDQLRKGRQR